MPISNIDMLGNIHTVGDLMNALRHINPQCLIACTVSESFKDDAGLEIVIGGLPLTKETDTTVALEDRDTSLVLICGAMQVHWG